MSEKPATVPPTSSGGKVIRRVEATEETPHERLVRKHVPAWGISGATHVGLIAVMILVFGARIAETKPPGKVVATSVEKEPETPVEDLTNEDLGLQADLDSAIPELERVDK